MISSECILSNMNMRHEYETRRFLSLNQDTVVSYRVHKFYLYVYKISPLYNMNLSMYLYIHMSIYLCIYHIIVYLKCILHLNQNLIFL